jgi:hypothetical protein
MRIYFSGGRGLGATPENLVPERKPHIMLTYHDIDSPGTLDRLNVYLQRVTGHRFRDKNHAGKILPEHYSEHVFMDSGAYSLYNGQVLKRHGKRERQGKGGKWAELHKEFMEGEELALDPIPHVRGEGDYSYYSLEPGSDFRKYCDAYAKFMKRMMDDNAELLFTNVDAIHNAEITWKIQKYFEDEHGLFPVPVVHAGASMRYVEHYLDAKKYPLLGMGGLGHSIDLNVYMRWADEVFTELCPRTNDFMPTSKTHGFAMTAWKLIDRWPWWSVDSATWVKLSAYGWLYVPRWSEGRWRFDKPPIQINLSAKSPFVKKVNKHIDNTDRRTQELIQRWLKRCNVVEGTVDKDGEMIKFGVRSHFRARSICNLYYLKDLEESRPKWPHRLSDAITGSRHVKYHKGFGFT